MLPEACDSIHSELVRLIKIEPMSGQIRWHLTDASILHIQ